MKRKLRRNAATKPRRGLDSHARTADADAGLQMAQLLEAALNEPLSYEALLDFLRIGRFGELGTVLIGGQALALWAERYSIALPPVFNAGLSSDVDFLGGIAAVRAAARAFGTEPIIREDRITDFGIGNAGQLLIAPFVGKQALLVDFLYAPLGLSPTDVSKQAILFAIPDRQVELRVMHPIHCLESRLANLLLLPHKRNEQGVQQASLSVAIARNHIARLLEPKPRDERPVFSLAERIFDIACSDAGCYAARTYAIHAMDAIPVDAFGSRSFQKIRYPQMCSRVQAALNAWAAARSGTLK